MALLTALHLSEDGSTPDIDRRFMGSLTGDGSRVVGIDSFEVSQKSGTPNMSVDVAPGRGWVLGTDDDFQGSYYVESTAVVNVVIAAADSTNPRKDVIVARVRDSVHAGGANDDWLVTVIEGTPASSPAVPTIDDSTLVLAIIDVEANETAIEDEHITDQRTSSTYNAGGYLTTTGTIVASASNYPASPEVGDTLFSTTEGQLMRYTGSKWAPASGQSTISGTVVDGGSGTIATDTDIKSTTITVPSWAATAAVKVSLVGQFNGTTSSVTCSFDVEIGTDTGQSVREYPPNIGVANQRFGVAFVDTITLTSTGSKTLAIRGSKISGSGTLQWDANTVFGYEITFKP